MASTSTEHRLITDAAFEFSLACRNKELAAKLGQQLRPRSLSTEELPRHSLPNPTLSLCASRRDLLIENLETVHRLFSMVEGQQARRLVMGIDHTYLSRQLAQAKVANSAGLVGAPWSPCSSEDRSFMPFSTMAREDARAAPAPLMLEALLWNPLEADKNRCFSIGSMPMALKAALQDPQVKEKNAGKWVNGPQTLVVDLLKYHGISALQLEHLRKSMTQGVGRNEFVLAVGCCGIDAIFTNKKELKSDIHRGHAQRCGPADGISIVGGSLHHLRCALQPCLVSRGALWLPRDNPPERSFKSSFLQGSCA